MQRRHNGAQLMPNSFLPCMRPRALGQARHIVLLVSPRRGAAPGGQRPCRLPPCRVWRPEPESAGSTGNRARARGRYDCCGGYCRVGQLPRRADEPYRREEGECLSNPADQGPSWLAALPGASHTPAAAVRGGVRLYCSAESSGG